MRPRAILADLREMFLDGLRCALRAEVEVVLCVRSGDALIEGVQELQPDLVILDAALEGKNGLEVLRHFQARPVTTCFVLTTSDANAAMAATALRLGARAYVPKTAPVEQLLLAVRESCAGNAFVPPELAEEIAAAENGNHQPPTGKLTKRELSVLELLANGKTFKEIGVSLGLSPRTVEFHRNNISRKTGLQKTTELARLATRMGLVIDSF